MSEAIVDIRPVTVDDAADLITLLGELQQESTTFTADPKLSGLSVSDEEAQLKVLITSPQNHLMVADYGGQLVGVASVIAQDTNVGEIGVAILKAYWNEGLGSALMEEMLYWAKTASSLHEVTLTVQLVNTYAKRLYRNLGFKVTRSLTVANAADETVPAQVMTLTIHHKKMIDPLKKQKCVPPFGNIRSMGTGLSPLRPGVFNLDSEPKNVSEVVPQY